MNARLQCWFGRIQEANNTPRDEEIYHVILKLNQEGQGGKKKCLERLRKANLGTKSQ
jgi:hypothetical protein